MTYIFLPHGTDQPHAEGPESEWAAFPQGSDFLVDFANTLDMPVEVLRAERIKGTPSPWARMLLFETALFDANHPAHAQVLGEWRGLLALVGLSRYLGVRLDLELVRFDDRSELLTNLRRLQPDDSRQLLERMTIIGCGGEGFIGGTSPRTLVFSSIRSIRDPGVPFYDPKTGRLTDPTACYEAVRDEQPLQLLNAWLAKIIGQCQANITTLDRLLGKYQQTGAAPGDTRANRLIQLFQGWQKQTVASLTRLGAQSPSLNPKFGDIGLGRSIEQPELEMFFGIVPSIDVEAQSAGEEAKTHPFRIRGESGKIIDPAGGRAVKDGRPVSAKIRLPRGQVRTFVDGVSDSPDGRVADSGMQRIAGLWANELIEVTGTNAEVASVLSADVLGKRRTYLFPFDSRIVDVLSDDQIREWTTIDASAAGALTVRLAIPTRSQITIEFTREYGDTNAPIVDLFELPDLAIWPDFDSPTWDEYLYLTYDREARRDSLVITPVLSTITKHDGGKGRDWGRLARYPRVWRATQPAHPELGGLLFVRPDAPRPAPNVTAIEWHIAIDFGSTQTRIFRRVGTDVKSTAELMIAPRAQVVVGNADYLHHLFMPSKGADPTTREHGIPSLMWLPLMNAISRPSGWLPGDGHIFTAPDIGDFPGEVVGNLKWRHVDDREAVPFQNFVKQVFLAIEAEAELAGAKIKSLRTAYPSVLPEFLRQQHAAAWSSLAKSNDIDFRPATSEAEAVANYLTIFKKAPVAANLIAVDVGGSTADFALWRGERSHFDSIKVAGNVFNQVVAFDAAARAAVEAAARSVGTSVTWDPKGERDAIIGGLLLRKLALASEDGLLSFGSRLYGSPGSAGARVVSHVAYAYAMIAYTLGLLTGPSKIDDDNYHIYFAGRGSLLLQWLDATPLGPSSSWFGQFFIRGRKFAGGAGTPRVNITHPTAGLKDEVGHGLLLTSSTTEQAVDAAASQLQQVTFVGETCYQRTDGKTLKWSDRLMPSLLPDLNSAVRAEVSEMRFLNGFLEQFDETVAGRLVRDALALRIALADPLTLRDLIHDRIFRAADIRKIKENEAHTSEVLVEPFFVTEAKVVLERATGNLSLFAN